MLMKETLDFDQTIGKIMKWAAKDGETLVVITADHETGGLTVHGGDLKTGTVIAHFSTNPFASLKAASKNHLLYISWPYTPRFRILLNATCRTMPLKAQENNDRLSPNRQWES